MSEPVLERSVLERKERDELQTIARAMGAAPPSRAKKADLVDLILTSAGIGPAEVADAAPTSNGSTDAPARPRRRKTTPAPLDLAFQVEAVEAESEPEVEPAIGAEEADATKAEPMSFDEADTGDSDTGDSDTGDPDTGDPDEAQTADSDESGAEIAPEAVSPTQDDQDGGQAKFDDASTNEPVEPLGAATTASNERTDAPADGRVARVEGPAFVEDEDTNDGGSGPSPRLDRERNRPERDRTDRDGKGRDEDDWESGNRRRRRRGRDRDAQGRDVQARDAQGRDVQARDAQGRDVQNRENRESQQREQRDSQQREQRDGQQRGGEQRDRPDEQSTGEPVEVSGLLDLRDEGYGFVRTKGYLASKDDAYVSVKQVRQFGLRRGDHLAGASRPANRNEKNPALLRIDLVNDADPESARRRPRFEDLTPLFPDDKLVLENPGASANPDMTARIIDLIAPIGKGQRGLIVSPPKAGKTTVLKAVVKSIEANNPEVHLMVLLIDERPEEVTDMRRSTKGEVIASTFDRPSEEHTAVTELAIERAKRLVENGADVVIVLDGITRLARAYNLAAPATGRVMSGGVDSGALYPPKRFFGSARNVEEGGSLTILATALIETGSKMDEVIFEEFKGTGNMELRLDRRLAERRIYPAIDVDASSTRHEELLFTRLQLQSVWRVRRALHALSAEGASPSAALERLIDGMKTFRSNDEFLAEAAKAGGPGGP